jgi:prevent-host-death family protein
MEMPRVGIRELKTHLSKYLKRVKQGQSLIITEHGRPIGRIVPEGASIEERLKGLEVSGVLLQTGGVLPVAEPVTAMRGDKRLSDLISEDRDVDHLP